MARTINMRNFFYENCCDVCRAYSYVDIDVKSCLFNMDISNDWDTALNVGPVGFKSLHDNMLELKKIFETKDNSGIFLKKINDAIYIWGLLTPIVRKLRNRYKIAVSKINSQNKSDKIISLQKQKFFYKRGFLIELFSITEDKEINETIREMLRSEVYGLCSIILGESKSDILFGSSDVLSGSSENFLSRYENSESFA